ncbi:unnamed protein product, partial [Ascophyllum nodosum]
PRRRSFSPSAVEHWPGTPPSAVGGRIREGYDSELGHLRVRLKPLGTDRYRRR